MPITELRFEGEGCVGRDAFERHGSLQVTYDNPDEAKSSLLQLHPVSAASRKMAIGHGVGVMPEDVPLRFRQAFALPELHVGRTGCDQDQVEFGVQLSREVKDDLNASVCRRLQRERLRFRVKVQLPCPGADLAAPVRTPPQRVRIQIKAAETAGQSTDTSAVGGVRAQAFAMEIRLQKRMILA
jgi:hypothetical protein